MEFKVVAGCVFLTLFGIVSSQGNGTGIVEANRPVSSLQCYDCTPNLEGDGCKDPERSTNPPRTTTCNSDANSTVACISVFLDHISNSNNTGTYRTCSRWPKDVAAFCDWYKEERDSNNTVIAVVKNCFACNNSRCNIHRFNADGSSGAQINLNNAFIILFNAFIFCIMNLRA